MGEQLFNDLGCIFDELSYFTKTFYGFQRFLTDLTFFLLLLIFRFFNFWPDPLGTYRQIRIGSDQARRTGTGASLKPGESLKGRNSLRFFDVFACLTNQLL